MGRFAWTEQTEKAALLLAKADLTKGGIADLLKVDRRTIWTWEKNPKFKARVDELVDEIRKEILRVGIADSTKRIQYLNDMAIGILRVRESRADHESMRDVPGGHTGLLLRKVKRITVESEDSEGKTHYGQREIVEHELDGTMLREFRDYMKQAAQELGQWVVKTEEVPKTTEVDPAAAERAMVAAADEPENTDESE